MNNEKHFNIKLKPNENTKILLQKIVNDNTGPDNNYFLDGTILFKFSG